MRLRGYMASVRLRGFMMAVAVMFTLVLMCACAGDVENAQPSEAPRETSEEPADAMPNDPQTTDDSQSGTPEQEPGDTGAQAAAGEVVITLDYEKQSGSASNQYAVWIEDIDGNLIKTLYATRYTANGGYRNRPDSIAIWVEKSALDSMSSSEVDAISGATPKAGAQAYTWDLTDKDGDAVPPGDYKFFVEGTLRWKNYVLYSGVIPVGDVPAEVLADAEYIYEGSDRYSALTEDSPENNMITAVIAAFTPNTGS